MPTDKRFRAGKWYTRIVGIFFLLVFFSLVSDYAQNGFWPETMHKLFHVFLGVAALTLGWRSELWWRSFPLINGLFFSYAALFGTLFPDFGSLPAFGDLATVLHTIVGGGGVIAALVDDLALRRRVAEAREAVVVSRKV